MAGVHDYIKINIRSSKTDQQGHGQSAFLVSNNKPHDPYILVCDYIFHFKDIFETEDHFLLPPLTFCKSREKWVVIRKSSVSYSTAYKSFKNLLCDFNIESTFIELKKN